MKNILRKFHKGSNHDHHPDRTTEVPPTSPSPSPSHVSDHRITAAATERNNDYLASEEFQMQLAMAICASKGDLGDDPDSDQTSPPSLLPAPSTAAATESNNDYLFLEEYQIQLAMAMSASNGNLRDDPDSDQIRAATLLSLGTHRNVLAGEEEGAAESLSRRYWLNQSGSKGLELYPHNEHKEENNGQSRQTTSEREQAECSDGGQFSNFRDEWSSLEVLYSDIKDATKDFDESSKIGKGGYGSVYKGKLGEIMVAIKLLDSTSKQGQREFFQELEVLYQMRHPNLVKLVGACFEVRALVYEYLPHGSLEDCLKENPSLLTWQMRTRIMHEICSALIYLHLKSVVHGDLKPANILLDANFKSKLSDFGLCRFLPKDKISAAFLETVPKGTSGYIDPWFLETCILRPGSDLYSFGITILKLLTGLPPIGLGRKAFDTDENLFFEMIDPTAGSWPFELAKELLYWSLQCCYHNEKSLELLEDMSTCLEDMLAEIETLQEGRIKVKVRRKKASKDPLKVDNDKMMRLMVDDDLTANSSSLSDFGDDNLAAGCWESKEIVSPDGDMKLSTQVFFASIDQKSEQAAGKSACTALVAVVADWFHSNQDAMPTKFQFDSLIQEGSLEWRKLCEDQTYHEHFPEKDFDLETVLTARTRPFSVVPEKSFVGFFPTEGMGVNCAMDMHGAISFENIWDEIILAGSECPQLYVVSWDDHFFVLKIEHDAYYIIETLGENLYKRCDRAYILKFDESTSIRKIQSESRPAGKQNKNSKESPIGGGNGDGAAEEELLCSGKESCKEYIKSFLAVVPIRELQAVNKRWGISSVQWPKPLQIEFHYTELAKDVREEEQR